MKRKMYCVKDSVADCFHMPFQALTDAEALRMVRSAAMSPDSNLSQFPNDYSLFIVGVFDDCTGLISSSTPELLVHVSTLIAGGVIDAQDSQPV